MLMFLKKKKRDGGSGGMEGCAQGHAASKRQNEGGTPAGRALRPKVTASFIVSPLKAPARQNFGGLFGTALFLLHSRCLEQCLGHSGVAINICGVNE